MLNLLTFVLPFLLLALAFSLSRVSFLREGGVRFFYRFLLVLLAVMAFCMELIVLNGARRNLEIGSPEAMEALRNSSFIYAYAGDGLLGTYMLSFGILLTLFLRYAFRKRVR
jgi:hypothetical protein